MKKAIVLASVLATGLTIAQAPQVIRIGFAFDAGGKFDQSFNQSAYEGGQKAVKELGVQVKDFEPANASLVGQGIRNFANAGFDLMIGVGFNNTSAITATAKDFPDLKFAVIDDIPTGPNTAGAVFREHEGSYLVGYIAGKVSNTGLVGFIGGMDIPLIHKFEIGYTAGVKAACPSCKVVANYIGNTPSAWNDPAKAKEIATNQASQGVDIFYSAAGASGLGMQDFVKTTKCVNAAKLPSSVKFKSVDFTASVPKAKDYTAKCSTKDRPMFFIGVDSNQNRLGDTDKNPATLNHGLTSMLKRVDVAVYTLIKEVKDNKFKSGAHEFGLSNDGVGYALDVYNQALISTSLRKELDQIRLNIIAGKIKVPFSR